MDYRKFNILLAYRFICLALPRVNYSSDVPRIVSFISIKEWMDTHDVHLYKYRMERREELFSLLEYKPISDWESFRWYQNAEDILNPFPEEDLWIVVKLLKTFLTNPQEVMKQIMDLPDMSNRDMKDPLTIESDNYPILLEEPLIPVKESSSLTDSELPIEQSNQKRQQLPSHTAMLLEMASKKFSKVNRNKK